jgi:hypothetical protein
LEEAVEPARGKGPIVVLYLETPANPTNGLVDLERERQVVSGLRGVDGKRPVIIVDSAMLGPIYQTPLAHGADLGLDCRGAIVLRQRWSRGQVEARFANRPAPAVPPNPIFPASGLRPQ